MTMEEEKRERIIDAALREFSKGYMKANTDIIVKEAVISKGLIFNYFGSKRGLFLFLIIYTLDIIISEYEKVISKDNDLIENLRIVSAMKEDMSLQNPFVFKFMVKAYSSIK